MAGVSYHKHYDLEIERPVITSKHSGCSSGNGGDKVASEEEV